MIFVFGGEFEGKSEYVRERFGFEAVSASADSVAAAPAVRDFHLFLRDIIKNGADIFSEIDAVLEVNPDIVIISNEIGCGVVPLDKHDREYREAVGRANCYLAKKAKEVIRVVCGIGQEIK